MRMLRPGLVLPLFALLTVYRPATSEDARFVVTMVVAEAERYQTDSYAARAQAVREVNLGFEVEGRLIERPADVGVEMREGDLLAVIDPAPYIARIRALEGERATLEAAIANAETELERRETLLEKGFVAQANVDDQATLVRAEAAKIEAVDGALDAARLNLSYTRLMAPFDGIVSEVFAENFQNVLGKQPVVRLLDTSQIEMEVSVPEGLIALAEHVEEVTVTFSSLPDQEITGRIARIGTEASLSTRTYPVTVVMDQPEGAPIQPGMAGRATGLVKLPEDWGKSGIEVPAAAVFSPDDAAEGDAFVWRIDEVSGRIARRPVELVGLGAHGILVRGLEAGERIVTSGASTLTEGTAVRWSQ